MQGFFIWNYFYKILLCNIRQFLHTEYKFNTQRSVIKNNQTEWAIWLVI